jgi:sporulation protein YpjB
MKKIIKIIFVLVIANFTLHTGHAFAKHDENHVTLKNLTAISDKVFHFVKENKVKEAKLLLEVFGHQFEDLQNDHSHLTNKEIRTILLSFDQLRERLNEDEIHSSSTVHAATEFRMILDALVSSHQPLWAERSDIVMSSFANLEKAVSKNDPIRFQASLNELFSAYDLIYPSLIIDLKPESLQRIDRHVRYLEQYRATFLQTAKPLTQIRSIANEFDLLFNGQLDKDEADPSVLWIMFSIGSIILTSLCFVGWKKYKGESNTKGNKVRRDGN